MAVSAYIRYIGIQRPLANSPAFIEVPAIYRALFFDLRRQHNGFNNGSIMATDGILGPLGWSHSSIMKGLKVLQEHGLIEQTRQGGIASMSKTCSLWAFTDYPVCENKQFAVKGRQASEAFKLYVPKGNGAKMRRKKKSLGPPDVPIGTPRVPIQVHHVTHTHVIGTPRRPSNFDANAGQVIDDIREQANSRWKRLSEA